MREGRTVLATALACVVAGCQSGGAPLADLSGDALARAQTLAPKDGRLAGLYAQSCKACHTVADTGAPLAGDRAAWEARWAKGLPALVQSTVGGLNGMPAGGQCFACTPADYEALIRFLAGREQA
ncbi:MAG: cytochrome c5 family protein [Deltaproteobacteria bacterium]|nr:cytochrome c5 family protein [Deltaproteobacteria bacterium]